MKKSILLIIMLILASAVLAQAPQAINYQAVARDAGGNLIANQNISFRLSILQGGAAGTVVYSESHLQLSNQFGLVTLEIGQGTVISGIFSDISWRTGPYYLKTEIDLNGGTSYQEMGTTQFLSVPYAFYCDTAYYTIEGIPGPIGPVGPAGPAGPSGPGNTLDMAYDQGGPGAGRIITADAGKVEINVPVGADNGCLRAEILDNQGSSTNAWSAIYAITSGIGNAGSFFNAGPGVINWFGGNAVTAYITNPVNPSSSLIVSTYGTGNATESIVLNEASAKAGVLGRSDALSPTTSCGVRAEGNGAERKAAALTIDNGAIRVAGVSRPAGKDTLSGFWTYISSYEGNGHAHCIGHFLDGTITNDLIIPESFIQLTPEYNGCNLFVQILSVNLGSADIRITRMGISECESVIVHYLIINPEPVIP